ncbi:MAG: hypothetical protein BroJett026_39600 [Betaproteobacteria bacterium]|nr:MAG: hypothetical protein BroJett026_39600 [Betaproteobacteria bacterium]
MPHSRLAAGLAAFVLAAAAAPATAATLSVDIPGCSNVVMSGNAPNYTITCTQQAQSCVVNATPASPQGNTTATLSVACAPGATSVTWQSSRDCNMPTVNPNAPLTATVSESGGRSCVYTAVANGGGSGSTSVLWQSAATQPPPNAPTGCAIVRTPSNGALGQTGGPISMSASCSGGGAVTSWTWRKNATSGWSSAQAPTDTLPANTGTANVTYTYGVTACAGTACAAEVTTTFTVAGATPVGFCSQYADVRFINLVWGGYIDTSGSGSNIQPGTVLVGIVNVPAGVTSPLDSPGVISVVEHQGPTAERVMSISPQPCDFRNFVPGSQPAFPAPDATGATKPMGWSGGINPQIQYLYDGDPPGFAPAKPLLTRGGTYYVNLQTIRSSDGQNSCGSTSCDVRITVTTPR